jgi:hypothetical protein
MNVPTTEDGIPTAFRIGGNVLRRIRYGEEEEDWGRVVASHAMTAVSRRASCTSSAVTSSAVRSAVVRHFTASVLMMTI